MVTGLIAAYIIIGIFVSVREYRKDKTEKKRHGDYFYVSALDRIMCIFLWPFVLLINIEV